MSIVIRDAEAVHAGAIAAIYNQGIADRGATFETEPRSASDIEPRLSARDRFPMLVATEHERVIGWAGLGSYRARACYSGIAEFSIYLERSARGRGIGRRLLAALIDVARDRGYWKLVSRIFVSNAGSRVLCRACAFREVGIYEKHSQLDGEWRDVVIVERLPENVTSVGDRTGTAHVSA
jgi:L-amino acid N-acyltransferase YncA